MALLSLSTCNIRAKLPRREFLKNFPEFYMNSDKNFLIFSGTKSLRRLLTFFQEADILLQEKCNFEMKWQWHTMKWVYVRVATPMRQFRCSVWKPREIESIVSTGRFFRVDMSRVVFKSSSKGSFWARVAVSRLQLKKLVAPGSRERETKEERKREKCTQRSIRPRAF